VSIHDPFILVGQFSYGLADALARVLEDRNTKTSCRQADNECLRVCIDAAPFSWSATNMARETDCERDLPQPPLVEYRETIIS